MHDTHERALSIIVRRMFNVSVLHLDLSSSDPTSVPKSTSILPAIAACLDNGNPCRSPVTVASPNILELAEMYNAARGGSLDLITHPSWWTVLDAFALGPQFQTDLQQLAKVNASENDPNAGTLAFLVDKGIAQMSVSLLPVFRNIVVKCAELGVIAVMRISGSNSGWAQQRSNIYGRYVIGRGTSQQETIVVQHFPALTLRQTEIVNVTGAGDSFVGSLLASILQNPLIFQAPQTLREAITSAQRAAVFSLQSLHAISPKLSGGERLS